MYGKEDNHKRITCQRYVDWIYANSHYIKRSHNDKGIEENIMTNCEKHHSLFEESIYREEMKEFAIDYFISKYNYWNEEMLIYKKYQ